MKYRLFRGPNSPYWPDKHPREDAFRAMRLVGSRAKEWNLDPNRMGIMGPELAESLPQRLTEWMTDNQLIH